MRSVICVAWQFHPVIAVIPVWIEPGCGFSMAPMAWDDVDRAESANAAATNAERAIVFMCGVLVGLGETGARLDVARHEE
jgi:hypothetical protein